MGEREKDRSLKELLRDFETEGYLIIEDAAPPEFVERARADLEHAIEGEVSYHGSADYQGYGMVLCCSLYPGSSFRDVFELDRLFAPIEAVLGEGCIVHTYTSSSLPPHKSNYSKRVHVDSPRLIPGYVTNIDFLMALDDFTEENGATYFLPRSHTRLEEPCEEEFLAEAKRFVARKGTALIINSRLWHAGGENTTDRWRHALSANLCRPWMKQYIDIPRVMQSRNIDTSQFSERALQKLGFRARTPASYEEFFLPKEQRTFRQKWE